MLKQSQVQQSLKAAFPQFCSKQQLIDYYVSFDFPQKQMKMVGWWQKVIEFIIEKENQIYITYQELVSYVSFYNLKPTPLPALINFLAKREVLVPQDECRVQSEKEKENKQAKSWVSSFLPFLSKPQKEKPIFLFTPSQRIFSKKLKIFKKQQVKNLLPQIYRDHITSIDQFKLTKQLQQRCSLDYVSVKQILKELQEERVVNIQRRGQREFVLFSVNQKDLFNKEWNDIESMKFNLREQIQKFEYLISVEEEKAGKLKEKAREQAQSNNGKSAKASLKEMLEKQKKIRAISTRKNLLQDTLTQLQYNEMNKSTILLLQESQKVYQQTMIDANRLDDLIEKNAEMQSMNKETNSKLQQMAEQEDLSEEVDEMFERLNREVEEGKGLEKREVKVVIEEPMDIEEPRKQHLQLN